MSEFLPLFPLPNVVLFPNVFLPLHIIEPRYRAMVGDAIAGDRMIGMVLLRPGWERDYDGRPPVYPVGCSGVLTHVERLADGRYNIVLRGLERFRILGEDHSLSYRRGIVESLPEPPIASEDRASISGLRAKIATMLASAHDPKAPDPKIPPTMGDEDLVNALAQYLDLEPLERQALLELHSLRARAESLVELLEIKIITARTPGTSNVAH
jgi:Lon protease-like protein